MNKMPIVVSFIITILLFALSTAFQFLIFSIPVDLKYIKHIIGLSYILPTIIAYSIILSYLKRYKNLRISIKEINLGFVIIAFLLIVVGEHLVSLPFYHWKSLSNNYFGTSYKIASNIKFDPFVLYKFFWALLLTPILEEIVFRYYILGGLMKKYTFGTSLLISSLLFSIIHISNPASLVPNFIFGIFCGIVYYRTGKIIYSIFLHSLSNLLWVLIVVFNQSYKKVLAEIGIGVFFFIICIIGIMLCYFGARILLNHISPRSNKTS